MKKFTYLYICIEKEDYNFPLFPEDKKMKLTECPILNFQIAVAQKLLICGLSLLFHMTITKTLPVEYNIDDNFRATASWPVRFFYLYVSLMAARPKYYFAWTLGKYMFKNIIITKRACI